MPQIGLGMCCRPTAYDHVLVERSILWFLLMGGRLIDGAHVYLNHRAIGRGIKEAVKRGVPREEVFVTTKIAPTHFGYNTTKNLVPTFLEELDATNHFDIALLDCPPNLYLCSWNALIAADYAQARNPPGWQLFAEVIKEFSWFSKTLTLDVPGPNDYVIDGSFWQNHYEFTRSGRVVAKVAKEY